MKAWVVRGEGVPWESFRLEEFPEPTHDAMRRYALDLEGLRERRPGEPPWEHYVFLRVAAASLAWPDVTMATGEYPVRVPRPYVSGQEAVGTVEDASPSLRHLVGQRVVAFTPQPFGSFAPLAVGTAPTVYPCPEGLSDEEAAAFLIPSHTAYHAVHRRGGLRAGETVLVLGAAGGVPSAAVQLAAAAGARVIALAHGAEKVAFCRGLGAAAAFDTSDPGWPDAVQLAAAAGARVIALARGAEKVAFCRGLGAAAAFDTSDPGWPDAVRREAGPRGVDMIVDFVQGEPGRTARRLLAVEGRHVMAGHAGGLLPVHPNEFYLQNWTLFGCCMGAGYGERLPEIEAKAHADIVRLIDEGRFRPAVGRVVAFDAIPAALRELAERRVLGRAVVRVR